MGTKARQLAERKGVPGFAVQIRSDRIALLVRVSEKSGYVPATYSLAQNYPNPFNPSTTTKFELPKSSDVKLSVCDLLGREVSVLVSKKRDAGVHEVKFDAAGLASGVYFYRLTAGSCVKTKKRLLARRPSILTRTRNGLNPPWPPFFLPDFFGFKPTRQGNCCPSPGVCESAE